MKRYFSCILSVTLALVLMFSGCGKKQVTTDSSNTGKDSNIVSAPGQLPIVKNKVELKFLTKQQIAVQDFSTNEFTKWLEEKTNVHIVWQTVPNDSAAEKINLILASGDYPDVFYNCGISTDQETQYGSDEKVFIPLNDLINNYAPNIKKAMGEFQDSAKVMTSPDGKIYSLANFSDCKHCTYSSKLWIYKPWLDKLGLKIPTTTDEFEKVLIAFKDSDPNGNGKKDEIPLTGANNGWNSSPEKFLINSFIYSDFNAISTNSNGEIGLYVDNGKINTIVDKPEFKEALKYIGKLYKEGLIYPGTYTQSGEQLTAQCENPEVAIVGATGGGWSGGFAKLGGDRYKGFAPMTPLKGPNGQQNAVTTPQYPSTGTMVICKSCKYPEVAVRLADFINTEEATLRLRRGVKGKEWDDAKPGQLGIDGKPATWNQIITWDATTPQNDSWVGGGVFNEPAAMRLGQSLDPNKNIYDGDAFEKLLYQATVNQYEPYGKVNKVVPPIRYLKEEQNSIATAKTEYAKYLRQSAIKFITGSMDIDKDWDKYVQGLKSDKQDDILKLIQTAYDRVYKK